MRGRPARLLPGALPSSVPGSLETEAGDAQGVLDGDLDAFVRAELLRRSGGAGA